MNSTTVGDLVWIPEGTRAWTEARAFEFRAPRLGLIKTTNPFKVLVTIEGDQKELSVLAGDTYDIGDFYD